MYQLKFLERENDLNKLIKFNKKRKENFSILFVSLWDDISTNLVNKVKEKYENSQRGEMVYVVDSFHMPHSFVIYKTTKVPHLVQLRHRDTVSEDYLPHILKALKIK
jgi:KaiC/GvpD/RAD55 family RecA-like ATPase